MAGNSRTIRCHCLPLGNLQLHTHPQPRKIIQTADVVVMLYEGNGGVRQLFTDGRPLPANDRSLVVRLLERPLDGRYAGGRTTGFRDGGWLDVNGSPLTDRGRTIERYRRTSYGLMDVEGTVDDPKAYTRPWTVTLKQRLMADDDLIEFVCLENERSSPHFQ
jgi:hypothetical protein